MFELIASEKWPLVILMNEWVAPHNTQFEPVWFALLQNEDILNNWLSERIRGENKTNKIMSEMIPQEIWNAKRVLFLDFKNEFKYQTLICLWIYLE